MILGIKGEKNSGKTSLIEKLLAAIDGKVEVVVIKSSSHDKFDEEGKDTWRYRKAGAKAAIIVGGETACYSTMSMEEAIVMAKKMHPDLIIIEGYEKVKGNVIVSPDESVEEVLKMISLKRKKIEIFVDGKKLPLNDFIAELFYKTIKAMLSTLKNGEGKEIDIIIND